MYRSKGKRLLDISLAAMGLMASLPFFVLLPPLLWVYFKGNPFFLQRRPGLDGKLFTILKFRTMHHAGLPVPWLGRVLRKYALDELPQFWNVLRGDMSIVGPRPLLPEYLPIYNATQHLRHAVKPGMTGLAQVRGRNALSWEEKLALDVHYVNHVSLLLDLRIMLATVVQLVLGRGVEAVPWSGNAVC